MSKHIEFNIGDSLSTKVTACNQTTMVGNGLLSLRNAFSTHELVLIYSLKSGSHIIARDRTIAEITPANSTDQVFTYDRCRSQ